MPNWFVAFPITAPSWYLHLDAPEAVRMLVPADLHMTLAYLGDIASDRVRSVTAQMQLIDEHEFELNLQRLIPLPSARHFSALSFTLDEGRTRASQIISAHRGGIFEAAGVAAESREVLPHVTIARPRRRIDAPQRREVLQWCSAVHAPRELIRVNRIALYTWSESPHASRYTIVSEHALLTLEA